jgi:hypothetical protein
MERLGFEPEYENTGGTGGASGGGGGGGGGAAAAAAAAAAGSDQFLGGGRSKEEGEEKTTDAADAIEQKQQPLQGDADKMEKTAAACTTILRRAVPAAEHAAAVTDLKKVRLAIKQVDVELELLECITSMYVWCM